MKELANFSTFGSKKISCSNSVYGSFSGQGRLVVKLVAEPRAWTAHPKEGGNLAIFLGWFGIDKGKEEDRPYASRGPTKAGGTRGDRQLSLNPATYREHPRPGVQSLQGECSSQKR
jgi:hypothetical protein